MVETYSSYCGTGAAEMVCVCTGSACGAACGGADLAQAASPSTATERQGAIQTGGLLKVEILKRKECCRGVCASLSAVSPTSLGPARREQEGFIQIVTLGCDYRGGCFTILMRW